MISASESHQMLGLVGIVNLTKAANIWKTTKYLNLPQKEVEKK